ncbi:MAG TPA: lipopolysaccharide assembly protein LapA domain-containing protein [Microvirga sp.]|nr:lipopolysaccharide assembly protein LapA domain-containing protein [Microvirga sp.]
MIRFLKALILLPVAILVVLLAVANREPVQVSVDPFTPDAPGFVMNVPLYAVVFAAVMLGVLVGGVAAWLAQSKHRRARRHYRREAQHLKTETDRMRAERPASTAPALPAPGSAY